MSTQQKSKPSHRIRRKGGSSPLLLLLQPSVFLLIAFVVCQSCLCEDKLDTREEPFQAEGYRLRRAPFRPPSVTSFEPSVRKANGSKTSTRFIFPGKQTLSIPPRVRSQIENANPPKNIPSRVPINGQNLQLPSSPFATSRRRPSHKPLDPNKKALHNLLLVQNDQHALELLKKQDKKQAYPRQESLDGNTFEAGHRQHTKGGSNQPEEWDSENVAHGGAKQETHVKGQIKYPDFRNILKDINMTKQQLDATLKKMSISLGSFVNFVEKGANKEDILHFLDLKNDGYHHVANDVPNAHTTAGVRLVNKPKPKMLTDLPFTEIVHEIPIRGSSPIYFDQLSPDANKDEATKKYHKHVSSWEDMKIGDIDDYINKKISSKQLLDQTYSDLDSNSLSLLPKDSPIVTHFRTPLKKEPTLQSASIVALTVEEKKPPHKPKEIPKSHIYKEHDIESGTFEPSRVSAQPSPKMSFMPDEAQSQKNEEVSVSQIKRNNMKFVFPMKGVLIFCAILGGLAFITILIFIAYAALKCNKHKPPKKFNNTQTNVIDSA